MTKFNKRLDEALVGQGGNMFQAHLSTPDQDVTKIANTKEKAVEIAFRELALGWMGQEEIDEIVATNGKLFDGWINGDEVWWYNHEDVLIGTVQAI